tara:strand:- start:9540 stop:11726 length:2187 start_codon:yes stop_codon:yes gene_type:complete
MKKFFFKTLFYLLIIILIILIFLSFYGYETDRFNNFIQSKLNQFNKNFKADIQKVKIKLDFKNFNLFLQTKNLNVSYYNGSIPIKEIRAYIPLRSIIQKEKSVKRIFLNSDEIEIDDLKKIIIKTKPSNFKSFILNNLNEGKIKTNLSIIFTDQMQIKDYEIDGYVRNLSGNILNKIDLGKINFIYSFKNNSGNFDSIRGELNNIPISSGKIEIAKSENIILKIKLDTVFSLDENDIKKSFSEIDSKYLRNEIKIKSKLSHNLDLELDHTFKVKDYNYSTKGELENFSVKFLRPIKSEYFVEDIQSITFQNAKVNFSNNLREEKKIFSEGSVSFNKNEQQKYSFSLSEEGKKNNLELNFDFYEGLNIKLINYVNNENRLSRISSKISIHDKFYFIDSLTLTEDKNKIEINNLKLSKNFSFISVKDVRIKTFNKDKIINNDFYLKFGKKIEIKGNKFDASNIINFINENNQSNSLNFTKNIEISLEEILNPHNTINKFNLLGRIEKGKFTKINSKGQFSDDKFLDISLIKNKKDSKKYIEIYSDHPKFLLSNNNFFSGLSEGKLLFTSVFDEKGSISNLTIENFKVTNAPGFVKLLSLADLGGMADLVEGEGLSFSKMEIKFNKNKKILKLDELYAIGPSISILMDGFVDSKTNLVSLRGTMIPAKNLNKVLSKIPVVGDILIPKEVGEGLFGVSFKMKGLPGDIKTSVNPLRTLTPRFIQRALGKSKN